MADIIIKNSEINEKGIFANRDFKKGEIILKWHPTKIDKLSIEKYPKKYIIDINGEYFLMNPPERFVNHSCNPNTNPDMQRLCDVAIKDIKKSEEITTYYGEEGSASKNKCNCGSENCKGFYRESV